MNDSAEMQAVRDVLEDLIDQLQSDAVVTVAIANRLKSALRK